MRVDLRPLLLLVTTAAACTRLTAVDWSLIQERPGAGGEPAVGGTGGGAVAGSDPGGEAEQGGAAGEATQGASPMGGAGAPSEAGAPSTNASGAAAG